MVGMDSGFCPPVVFIPETDKALEIELVGLGVFTTVFWRGQIWGASFISVHPDMTGSS